MKTQILSLLVLALPFFNHAQITIAAEDLPEVGETFITYEIFEELPIANMGANQVWDFSNLVADDSSALILELPDSCFNSAMYPEADFCQEGLNNGFYNYYSTDNGQLNYLGFTIENWNNTGPVDVIYDPDQLLLPTPLTYEDSYLDSAAYFVTLLDNQGNPWIQVTQSITSNSVIDGWGTLLLPNDSQSVLRQTNTTIINEIDEEFVDGEWVIIGEFSLETKTTQFLAKEGYSPILSQIHDPNYPNIVQQTVWNEAFDFSTVTAPVADFEFFVDMGNGVTTLFLSDASSNWPTEFVWSQNGNELSTDNFFIVDYTQDATVEICLTASNNIGSDQICKTIDISILPPVVAAFTANEVQPMSGFYNFTNQSTGDITYYYWTIDGDNFSIESDPSYLFSSSGIYEVCLYIENDNFISDQFCTTLNVQIGTAPTTNFNWNLLDNPGEYSFVDESTNDPTSWSWDFGDGNTSDLQNPSHTFTADGPFFVCLTATNNFGSDVNCVNLDVNVGTRENQFPNSWSVFPNPTSEFINIHFGTAIPYNGQLSIYNMQGQLMHQKNINADQLLDVKTLASGMLVLKIVDSKGQTYISRIIKK